MNTADRNLPPCSTTRCAASFVLRIPSGFRAYRSEASTIRGSGLVDKGNPLNRAIAEDEIGGENSALDTATHYAHGRRYLPTRLASITWTTRARSDTQGYYKRTDRVRGQAETSHQEAVTLSPNITPYLPHAFSVLEAGIPLCAEGLTTRPSVRRHPPERGVSLQLKQGARAGGT